MSKTPGLAQPIPEAKIVAFRQALKRDREVVFQNGVRVVAIRCARCQGTGENVAREAMPRIAFDCRFCKAKGWRLEVHRRFGGVALYTLEEIRSAYAMALRGPEPKKGITGRFLDPAEAEKFGDEAPW